MNRHIYLRAFMAGVAVPSVLLLGGFTAFMVARGLFHHLAPIERVLIFPLAIVPNAFGLWNMLYVAQRPRWHMPIGLHGALLPFLLAPPRSMSSVSAWPPVSMPPSTMVAKAATMMAPPSWRAKLSAPVAVPS